MCEHADLARQLGVARFFEKQDGKTGSDEFFGGNKVRKLGFLLAEAMKHREEISSIITYGCAGSNHALATAAYAHKLGVPCILMLKPQHNSHVVRRNLLMDRYYGAQLVPVKNNTERALVTAALFKEHKQRFGKFPYLIPTGGSCPLGILGFVNAIFELKDQIAAGLMPEPDRMYAPLGSAGTVTGLLIGLKATGLKSRLHAITVEPEETPGEFVATLTDLFTKTVTLLRAKDPAFPALVFNPDDLDISYEHCGDDYALFTQEAVDAIRVAKTAGMQLDGVYTGKTFAGMVASLKESAEPHETILFWNTFDGRDFADKTARIDYHTLPEEFHKYFEEPVQELDRDQRVPA